MKLSVLFFLNDSDLLLFIDDVVCLKIKTDHNVFIHSLLIDTLVIFRLGLLSKASVIIL